MTLHLGLLTSPRSNLTPILEEASLGFREVVVSCVKVAQLVSQGAMLWTLLCLTTGPEGSRGVTGQWRQPRSQWTVMSMSRNGHHHPPSC